MELSKYFLSLRYLQIEMRFNLTFKKLFTEDFLILLKFETKFLHDL